MKVRGHVEGNVVIIDDDVTLPEGEEVTVEVKRLAQEEEQFIDALLPRRVDAFTPLTRDEAHER